MRTLLAGVVFLFSFSAFSQKTKVLPKKYPSVFWEITGNGLTKPSYLFGTMHVSSKMVFHLPDSFYIALKNADVVALETNPGTWQENFSHYNLAQNLYSSRYRNGLNSPQDYLTINTLQFSPYEKMIEAALYSSPSMINSFLYRTNSEQSADFEEDTYLDLYIFQIGKKWGKKLCGVEDFDKSMQLMKEAYLDAANDKNTKQKIYDYDEDFSYAKLEDAYRTGNLDLLDTINKVNSTSAAFDEKFLYRRNETQAHSIDSILRLKQTLFVGVGAAHLPGQRGVIELLRRRGYKLRPIKISERDSKQKDAIEKIRVPVQFSKQTSADNFFSVNMPGKLYSFSENTNGVQQQQYADMSNGSYYMVTRINTNAALWGHSIDVVLKKVDSVIYENIPGKILTKQAITRNGYKGFDITNRTRRGDFQRYNVFITPFEVLIFKMSGNDDYVRDGKEADQFFNSIELKEYKNDWKKYSASFGGFEAEMPHQPIIENNGNWQFMTTDNQTGTSYEIIRTDVHNYDFAEEDSFDLNLMEESFATSEFIDKQISRKQTKYRGFPALEAKYKYKDGSIALVKFLIQGPHYYTLVTHGKVEEPKMYQFLNSFAIIPFIYPQQKKQTDTSLCFTVSSPVPVEKIKKLEMYPENLYSISSDDEAALEENGTLKSKLITNDSTGEKIYVSFYKPSRYYQEEDSVKVKDSTHYKTGKQDWIFRSKKKYTLPNQMKVYEAVLGDPKSSRCIHEKIFRKDGVYYRIQTESDTLSQPGSFVTSFFESFAPSDTVQGVDVKAKKSNLFFADFFSKDSLLQKRAVKNIDKLDFDSSDLNQIKKAMASLSWNEKKYLEAKKDFISGLSSVKSRAASDYLKEIYYAAGDTVELQYAALQSLLQQKNSYAYETFKNIMVNDPPVLNVNDNTTSYTTNRRMNFRTSFVSKIYTDFGSNFNYANNNTFIDNLTDSLQLTAKIFKDILPLINIHDYEQPLMQLMGTLIDSNLISAKDYELYEPKFLLEAKQQWKKQIIIEKNKSIEKAQQDVSNKDQNSDDDEKDNGNTQLNLYATLLLPFYDQNPAVQQFINQLLNSNDKRLKYSTAILLLRNSKPVFNTLLNYFAATDEYRYELYSDLKENKLLNRFPAAYNNQIALAKSKLLNANSYNVPDTIVYIDKLPVTQKERSGFVYFFKYKQKKEENTWKLGTVGIVPGDEKQFEFDNTDKPSEESQYDFTELTNTKMNNDEPLKDQLQKALRKLQYAKRNSAAQFYASENSGTDFLRRMKIGE